MNNIIWGIVIVIMDRRYHQHADKDVFEWFVFLSECFHEGIEEKLWQGCFFLLTTNAYPLSPHVHPFVSQIDIILCSTESYPSDKPSHESIKA